MYHLKFYADCPEGERNKLFCYSVHDGKHAADLLAKFIAKSFRLKAAFIGLPGERGQQISKVLMPFIGNLATATTLFLKYPPRIDVSTPSKANQLAPEKPTPGRTNNLNGYRR